MKDYRYECPECRIVIHLRLPDEQIPLENPPCSCKQGSMTGTEVNNLDD